MTLAITPEKAKQVLSSRPQYATVNDFKNILSGNVFNQYNPGTLIVDTGIRASIDKKTTLPHWVIRYLYNNRDKSVEQSDLTVAAISQGYRKSDMYAVKKFLEETQGAIGIWYESKERKTYYRWWPDNELTRVNQAALDRGEDW